MVFRDNVPQEWRQNTEYINNFCDYYGAVEGLDEQFGRLMAYLEAEGLAGSTIVVLSADHGDCMGSHGRMGKNIWYEESIKIPCYMRGPGIQAGHTDVLFTSPDHMPTLLDLLDIPVPATVEGHSLADWARGCQHGTSNPQEAFICMMPGMPELIEEYRKLGLNHKAFGFRGLRTKTAVYIVDNGVHPGLAPRRLLYDLEHDPYQMNPQELSKNSTEAILYDGILKTYLIRTRDPFWLREAKTC